jgi:hypothetical protein
MSSGEFSNIFNLVKQGNMLIHDRILPSTLILVLCAMEVVEWAK